MRDLSYLNEYRIDIFGNGNIGDNKNGAFNLRIKGSPTKVIASNGGGWDHVSVSHANRIPSWETMQIIKEMFFEDNEVVMQLHPAKKDYINIHPYCLHLWKPQNEEIPTPPKYMIG